MTLNSSRRELILTSTLAVVVAISLIVFAVRLGGIVSKGLLFDPTGAQAISIYGVWKVQNQHPLYEWPDRDPFAFTAYNYLFIYIYATILSALGVTDSSVVLGIRLLSAIFALLGACATFCLVLQFTPRRDRVALLFAGLMAVFLWFGTMPMGWWNLSSQPDVLALTFATVGLAAYTYGDKHQQERWPLVTAGVLFFCAWACKQSTVAILTAVSLHAGIWRRQLRRFLWLTVPPASLMLVSLVLGGEVYRRNILWAQTLFRLIGESGKPLLLAKIIAANSVIWLYPVTLLGLALLSRVRQQGPHPALLGAKGLSPLVLSSLVATVWDVFVLLKEGSADNCLIEAHLCLGVLTTVLLLGEPERQSSWQAGWLAIGLIAFMAAYPLGQLCFRVEPMRVASDAQYTNRESLARAVAQLPNPVLVMDSMIALPWFSSNNEYPAYVIEEFWYNVAARRNELRDGGIAALVAQRRFGALVLGERWSGLIPVAEQSGYVILPSGLMPGMGDNTVLVLRPSELGQPGGRNTVSLADTPGDGEPARACRGSTVPPAATCSCTGAFWNIRSSAGRRSSTLGGPPWTAAPTASRSSGGRCRPRRTGRIMCAEELSAMSAPTTRAASA